jgi:hypothetical protein
LLPRKHIGVKPLALFPPSSLRQQKLRNAMVILFFICAVYMVMNLLWASWMYFLSFCSPFLLSPSPFLPTPLFVFRIPTYVETLTELANSYCYFLCCSHISNARLLSFFFPHHGFGTLFNCPGEIRTVFIIMILVCIHKQ